MNLHLQKLFVQYYEGNKLACILGKSNIAFNFQEIFL